jgi:hypothetical protein
MAILKNFKELVSELADWALMVQNRDQWWAFVKTLMNSGVQ